MVQASALSWPVRQKYSQDLSFQVPTWEDYSAQARNQVVS